MTEEVLIIKQSNNGSLSTARICDAMNAPVSEFTPELKNFYDAIAEMLANDYLNSRQD